MKLFKADMLYKCSAGRRDDFLDADIFNFALLQQLRSFRNKYSRDKKALVSNIIATYRSQYGVCPQKVD